MNLRDILESKPRAVTIVSATTATGIDRTKAEKILDPHGYFAKNKRRIKRPRR